MPISDSVGYLQQSFADLSSALLMFVPQLIIGIVIFVLGWLVGAILGRIVSQVINALRVDGALRSAGVEDVLARGGFSLNTGYFFGELVKWFIIVAFLIAALEVLGLTQVNLFLQQVVLLYIPNVIVAAIIILLAAVIADLAKKVVVASAKATGAMSAHFAGGVAKWSIWVFAILIALAQLNIATEFMQMLFLGVVTALSLAFGLAFGLGGKEAAADYIKKLRDDISHRD